jgi:hypothetical protein
MSYISYTPDVNLWTKYFVNQASRKNGEEKKVVNAGIGGGVAMNDDDSSLTLVGEVKTKKNKREIEDVKINVTSPSEATVEQAKSEMKHTSEGPPQIPVIYSQAVKRAGPRKRKSKKLPSTNSKKYRTSDVFGKKN